MCIKKNIVQLELFENFRNTAQPFIKLEDIFRAYYECRQSKRRTVNALAFELDFERELVRLWKDINNNTYKVGRSIAFIVKEPVQREVFAADFRDRIVHHLIAEKINSLFEGEFIQDSYSCRTGKGTLYGIKRIDAHIKECSENYTRDCYVLKLDIQSFFMSLDKTILYKNLEHFLQARYNHSDRPIILRLIRQIIFYQPENKCVIKGNRSDWNGLPYYKSLFWSAQNCGLPIGNLTSQIFANFYLHSLDKFVAEKLKIKHYGRYVDDFILIHQDKQVLLDAHKKIKSYLWSNLRLNLHPRKFYLQHYSKGVRFIGAIIKPNRIYIGTRTKTNLYKKIRKEIPVMAQGVGETLKGLEHFISSVNSYLGFMRYYNTYRLRNHILDKIDETHLREINERDEHAYKLSINKMFLPAEQKKRQLRRQRQYRRHQKKARKKYADYYEYFSPSERKE